MTRRKAHAAAEGGGDGGGDGGGGGSGGSGSRGGRSTAGVSAGAVVIRVGDDAGYLPPALESPDQHTPDRSTAATSTDTTCVICLGLAVSPEQLACGHAFCGACLADLRASEVQQSCPLCREALPDGLDGLFDLATRAYWAITRRVERGELTWELPRAEQEEMAEVIVMLTECGVRGRVKAQAILGDIFSHGYGVAADHTRAFEWCEQAAKQGHCGAQVSRELVSSDHP